MARGDESDGESVLAAHFPEVLFQTKGWFQSMYRETFPTWRFGALARATSTGEARNDVAARVRLAQRHQRRGARVEPGRCAVRLARRFPRSVRRRRRWTPRRDFPRVERARALDRDRLSSIAALAPPRRVRERGRGARRRRRAHHKHGQRHGEALREARQESRPPSAVRLRRRRRRESPRRDLRRPRRRGPPRG